MLGLARQWAWRVLKFHEVSFALRPTAEWIRIDLPLALPVFTCGNLPLTWYGFRERPGWWVLWLAGSALAAPVWFFGLR